MKFDCKTINLKSAISKVERIVSKQTTLPILGNILLKIENNQLTVVATNLEIAIKIKLPAKITGNEEITIPGRILSGFLSNIKDEVVFCEIKDRNLIVKTKNHKLKIKGMDAKDFPIIPKFPQKPLLVINSNNLNKAISVILTSIAHNDTRQELNGVFVKFFKESLVLASTDSFRLSEVKIKLNPELISEDYLTFIKNTPSIIIPANTFIEIQRLINGDNLEINIEQNQLFVKNGSVRLISRLINGNYPDYKQILPKNYDIQVNINKEELLNALKIASLVASDNSNEVHIKNTKENKSLEITTNSVDLGENSSKILANIKGVQFEVVFNCSYLLDGLNALNPESETVVLKLNKQKSPVLIREIKKDNKEEENFSYVIMPIIKE